MPHIALVVEDDALQRSLLSLLLEESQMEVIQCESAEAAERVLERSGRCLSLLVTDVELAGPMTGLELAQAATDRFPNLSVVVTSGTNVGVRPPAKFCSKPWLPLDILREAELSMRNHQPG
jgi:two-component system, cell cycle response regulator CpdR